VFGSAVFAFGLVTLAWPDCDDWLQMRSIGNAQDWRLFIYAAAAAQIFGGAAMQFRRTEKASAVGLAAVYLTFALLCVPRIVATPQVYIRWGNFFEQFSLATGALIVYARSSFAWKPATLNRIARILFGLCTTSFSVEQATYLDATASLVPKWLPLNQVVWAWTTTVAFALAAGALLTNRMALLAARLLTLMIVLFGLLVWMPLLLTFRYAHTNWGEICETFAIAGAAWILADLLGEYRADGASIVTTRDSDSGKAETIGARS
jgi:hypothetical protein